MELLPLGTIVEITDVENAQKAMIIGRLPLTENNDKIGYFDYSAVAYPQGQMPNENFFFNHEDIKKICFEGYTDDDEEKYQEVLREAMANSEYPKFKMSDFS